METGQLLLCSSALVKISLLSAYINRCYMHEHCFINRTLYSEFIWAPYIMLLGIEEGVRGNCLIAEQEVQNVSYESFPVFLYGLETIDIYL